MPWKLTACTTVSHSEGKEELLTSAALVIGTYRLLSQGCREVKSKAESPMPRRARRSPSASRKAAPPSLLPVV